LRSSGRPPVGALPRVFPGYMARPYLVSSLADLSADLVSAARAKLPPGRAVRRIFVVPPQEYPGRSEGRFGPGQALIFSADGVIHVQQATVPGQPAQARLVPNADVLYVQAGQLLLYDRLEIGYAEVGQAQQVVVEYNSVGWDLLQPGLADLLRNVSVAAPPPPVDPETPAIGAAEIERLPFKYANGIGIYTLAPGERLLALAFQPDIWARRYLIFRRQVTPAIVLALTDRHVSLIEEQRALDRSRSYGWIFSFFPLHGVTGMRSQPAPLGRLIGIELLVAGATATHELELTAEVTSSWEAQWRAHGGRWRVEDENGQRAVE